MKKEVEVMEKEEKTKKKEKSKKIPKEVSQEIMKQIFKNILIAAFVIIYFAILNFANSRMKLDRLVEDLKIFAGVFFATGIVLLEKAYKKDSGKIVIPAVEWIIMSFHTLSIMHVIKMYEYNFMLYLLTSSYVIAIYFVLKCIIIYTKGRREYLKQFSDISEIVKKEEPIVKEATKKNINKEEAVTVKPKTIKKRVPKNKKVAIEEKSEKKKTLKVDLGNVEKKKENATKTKKSQNTQTSKRTKKADTENKENKKVRGKEND